MDTTSTNDAAIEQLETAYQAAQGTLRAHASITDNEQAKTTIQVTGQDASGKTVTETASPGNESKTVFTRLLAPEPESEPVKRSPPTSMAPLAVEYLREFQDRLEAVHDDQIQENAFIAQHLYRMETTFSERSLGIIGLLAFSVLLNLAMFACLVYLLAEVRR